MLGVVIAKSRVYVYREDLEKSKTDLEEPLRPAYLVLHFYCRYRN